MSRPVGRVFGWALALLYAGLPCVFKLAALVALSRGVITAPEENP